MDILASYNWVKEYLHTNLAPDAFAREVSLRSMSVDKITHFAERFAHIIVGQVNELRPHPSADRLRIVTVNVGDHTLDIVCGGTNVVEGMRVAVALPGATVVDHEGKSVALTMNTIRGVESPGMLCAPGELGFSDLEKGAHEIWDLTALTDAKAGTPLAQALGLDDTIFTMEVTTNRPDAKGIVGLARDAAAAIGAPFAPGKYETAVAIETAVANPIPFSVAIDDAGRCFRQMAVVMDGVTVQPSPWWLQARLLLAGVRPINNIVDITNYVMLECAQPLHAFDYRTLEGNEIRVRAGKPGEQLVALNGKTYDVSGILVLADSVKALDVAGIMGGEHTGTTATTTTIVLCASAFDAVAIRRASRALNLQSDAQLLFEKGLSTEAPPFALARAVALITEIAGGHVASALCDERVAPYAPLVLPLRPDMVRDRIGVPVSDERIIAILSALGFVVDAALTPWQVTVPWWRDRDIESEVDFTEEVARIYGYHEMPSVLPSGAPPRTIEHPSLTWERWLKRFLAAAGYEEFFSNSFLAARDVTDYDGDLALHYRILNPLSQDWEYMRTSLVPSALRAVESNQGHATFGKFFELSRVYGYRVDDIPDERMHLVMGQYGYEDPESAYREVKGVLAACAAKTGIVLTYERQDEDVHWHPTRSARIVCNGTAVGVIGEVSAHTQSAFGVDRRVMLAVLDCEALFPQMHLTHHYVPVPEYPAITRDISVVLDEHCAFADLVPALVGGMITKVELQDIYRGNGVPDGKKSVTLSFTLQAPDRTLTSEDAQTEMERIGGVLGATFGGILRT